MNDTSNLSYPGSRRIYVPGRLYPDVRVPMREIILGDTLLPDGTAAILGGDAEGCYRRLLDGARLLERGGCTALAIPCNTSHYFADRLQGDIAIPLIHMPRETVGVLAADGKKRAGIISSD